MKIENSWYCNDQNTLGITKEGGRIIQIAKKNLISGDKYIIVNLDELKELIDALEGDEQ